MRLKAVISMAVGLGVCAGAASAQDRANRFVQRDGNGDGVLSLHEYQSTGGHPGNFRALDINGDGVLSRGEFVDRDGRIDDDTVFVEQARDPNVLTKVEFGRIDVNRDNVLTKREWGGDATTFRKLDINGDGYVSSSEYLAAAPLVGSRSGAIAVPANNGFHMKDRNRDGLLTRAEYGDRRTFDRVDRDNDGRITLTEFRNPPPVNSVQGRFDRLDRNNDGVVSRREWNGTTATFRVLDRNRDGRVTRNEFAS